MRWRVVSALVVTVLSVTVGSAAGSVLVVDDDADPATCGGNAARFATIGAALAAASSGDTILVCPGAYAEQVTVKTDDVILQAQSARAAIIRAPAGAAVVRVDGATNVTLRDFTISGSGGGGCRSGVRVERGGSVILEGNNIRDSREPLSSSC